MFVCLLFYRPHEISYLAALPPSPRAGAVAGGPARAGKHAHREHARMPYNFSTKKSYADAFQKQNRTRAHPLIYVTAEIFKKITNMPLPKFSLHFAFSWSPYFSNRTESYSSQIEFAGPHGITENQATYLHCGGEARAKKRARPPATCRKASTGKTEADTGPEGCGSPAAFPSPCLGDSSTKTTIMTVQTKLCRLRILNGESFRSVRQVISCCFTPRNFSLSEYYGVLISSSNRVHGPRNCSQEGSRTASRFIIQVDRDGQSNCSQLGSRPSPANKPCLCRGDSRRSSGQTRRRSASDGCRKGR